MKGKLGIGLLIVGILICAVVFSLLRKMPTLLDGHSTSNYNHDGKIGAVYPSVELESAVGQAFKVKAPSDIYKLIELKVYLKRYGTPTGHLQATLYNKTGSYGIDAKPTGSPLASSELADMQNLRETYSPVTFDFVGINQYHLFKDMVYCVVIQVYDGILDITNCIGYKGRYESDGCTTHDGNQFRYAFGWHSKVNYDLCFHIYGEPT